MNVPLHFNGFIRDVKYTAHLTVPLTQYGLDDFDINSTAPYGLVELPTGVLAFSKWVSPKRTRTYPFERIYNTFNSPVRLTVIPILKDEGADGDLDRIQYSTVSWMNLLNIYIVLAYYSNAIKNTSEGQRHRNKLTMQILDSSHVKEQILEIGRYKQSALHWNRSLIQDRFIPTFTRALGSYAEISARTNVRVHGQTGQQEYLERLMQSFEAFKEISLRGSRGAALRETKTAHGLEYVAEGAKATFEIENYLGGVYHLTADEVVRDEEKFIIQECKNATQGSFPSISDIKDGLFKLILFSNLDSLAVGEERVQFSTRLKLTGTNVRGSLRLPSDQRPIRNFLDANASQFRKAHHQTIDDLNNEARNNRNLEVEIQGNE